MDYAVSVVFLNSIGCEMAICSDGQSRVCEFDELRES